MNDDQIACLQAYSALNNNVQELGGTISELNHTATLLNDRMRGLERRLLKIYTPFRSSIYAYNSLAEDEGQTASKLPEIRTSPTSTFAAFVATAPTSAYTRHHDQQPSSGMFSSNCPQF
ncbi:hypothetical protein SARC_02835 [Sphaeroforma arctica JP610]|uniref:Uncharacterized protein n=1 Tax=Sphaeroforma arctica JP610 TaxID=667725 RepID=A0A0L0G7K6_9EUKA|nr:hypothetical protein SARC_02835 [Sphaeroforma arctica JP610]KNC84980.1 hypothetical protein SARC_02835 [Sphaeroforma arctica JP610]|eukprot:XP_014158882.1 hypothetical protein SARC_02835 [Sphaeroforma arctica JP610]